MSEGGYGDQAEVIRPHALGELIAKRGQGMLARYKQDRPESFAGRRQVGG